jgi:spheroidene monooxygenase
MIERGTLVSLHVARYGLANAVRSALGVRLHDGELEQTPGLVAGALFVTANFWTAAVPGPKPTPRRNALFCCWETQRALDEFVRTSPIFESFKRNASETWHVTLELAAITEGRWREWPATPPRLTAVDDDDPVCVMTYGRVRPRHWVTFWGANARVVRQASGEPGMLALMGMADRPGVASTISFWRSLREAKRFAYGRGDHAPIVRPSRTVPWFEERFFARFRVLASRGSFGGVDPFGELRAAPALSAVV